MHLAVGTSGFSYDAWKGSFYPDGLPAKERLAYYALRLPAVEINNTFYRMPRASVLEGWAAAVPESFRFALKVSRKITHFKRLKATEEELAYLLETVKSLGEQLGVLLFQLPPNLKADLERLEAFLSGLPAEVPAAFEFRHPSWEEAGVADTLRAHGAALVCTDTDEDSEPPTPVSTASWGYLRLRRSEYTPEQLTAWAARLTATGWDRAFVFFKHEVVGPALAEALLQELSGS
jgi:uncharacterized protein YecE (DUF72 family)